MDVVLFGDRMVFFFLRNFIGKGKGFGGEKVTWFGKGSRLGF